MNYNADMLKKNKDMHSTLYSKMNKSKVFACTSDTNTKIQKYIDQGFVPAGRFFTINRKNDFHESLLCINIDNKKEDKNRPIFDLFAEDFCEDEDGIRIEREWLNHDQVIALKDIDFTNDPHLSIKYSII